MQLLDSHDDQLKLAEFTLGTISTSLDMFSDSSMKASVQLSTCLLDDKRPSIKMVTSRSEEHTHTHMHIFMNIHSFCTLKVIVVVLIMPSFPVQDDSFASRCGTEHDGGREIPSGP